MNKYQPAAKSTLARYALCAHSLASATARIACYIWQGGLRSAQHICRIKDDAIPLNTHRHCRCSAPNYQGKCWSACLLVPLLSQQHLRGCIGKGARRGTGGSVAHGVQHNPAQRKGSQHTVLGSHISRVQSHAQHSTGAQQNGQYAGLSV